MDTTGTYNLTSLAATALAQLIAQGDVTSEEVVEAHIQRIEAVNPALNAVVVQRFGEARAEAKLADERRARGEPLGPLHGVPVTVKESLDLTGTPSTFGIPSRARALTSADDPHVERIRAAGAIVLGKTNVSQLLMYVEADNPVYGRTMNPWDPARTSGGSSGGEAAIIATGGSPLGLGTDWGGSVRVPSAFCGIAGFKPTSGRLDDAEKCSLPAGERSIVSQVGPLARSVDDLILAMGVLTTRLETLGTMPVLGDPASVSVSRLRIGYYTDDGTFGVSPAIRRAVTEAAGILAGQGAQVVEWAPPDVPHALDLFFGIVSADGGKTYARLLGRDKRDPRVASLLFAAGQSRPVVRILRGLLRMAGQNGTARMLGAFGHRDTYHYWHLVEQQIDYVNRFLRAMDEDPGGSLDVLICPVAPIVAFQHGAAKTLVTSGGYAPLYNVLGFPAGALPVTRVREGEESSGRRSLDAMQRAALRAERGSTGLPVAVQIVARPWQDHVALAVMKAVEQAARANADYPVVPRAHVS